MENWTKMGLTTPFPLKFQHFILNDMKIILEICWRRRKSKRLKLNFCWNLISSFSLRSEWHWNIWDLTGRLLKFSWLSLLYRLDFWKWIMFRKNTFLWFLTWETIFRYIYAHVTIQDLVGSVIFGNRENLLNIYAFLNPFIPNSHFVQLLNTPKILQVFCFQGAENGCIGKKWVNKPQLEKFNNLKFRLLCF